MAKGAWGKGWGDWTMALLFKFSKCLIKYHSVAATSAGVARMLVGSARLDSLLLYSNRVLVYSCILLHSPYSIVGPTHTHTHVRTHVYALCTVVVTFIHSWRSGHAGGPSHSASLSLWTLSASEKFVWHFHGVCQGAQVSVTLKCRCTHTHTHPYANIISVCVRVLVCVCLLCLPQVCTFTFMPLRISEKLAKRQSWSGLGLRGTVYVCDGSVSRHEMSTMRLLSNIYRNIIIVELFLC